MGSLLVCCTLRIIVKIGSAPNKLNDWGWALPRNSSVLYTMSSLDFIPKKRVLNITFAL